MKNLIATLALALALVPAHAATAVMVSCTTGTSFSGMPVYIGTYSYGGRYFQAMFSHWCPMTVEV